MELEDNQDKMSFIRARDPSILAWNRAVLKPNRKKLEQLMENELLEEELDPEPEEDNNIKVYLRIKKGVPSKNLYEVCENTLTCKLPEGSHSMRNAKEGESVTKKYTFSEIFGPEASQSSIFNSIVKPNLLSFINGMNNTLLTYGASGSGKTFTVVGSEKDPGIIPRALEYLFRSIPELSENPTVKPLPNGQVTKLNKTDQKYEMDIRDNLINSSMNISERSLHSNMYRKMQERLSKEPAALVNSSHHLSVGFWVSFAEIYNEYIYDLLVPDPPRGKGRTKLKLGSSGSETYIKNLTNVSVTSGEEAYQILQYGLHNLNFASTSINSHSSRSHCIFTIKLVQMTNSNNCVQINHFNFCDLAGTERLKKTNNIGVRLKESNNINTSLLVLGRCISIVRDSQKNGTAKVVPFRESKLTQLFQKALQGHEQICMIVNVNLILEMFDESQHVLNFSAIAKDILVEEKKPVIHKMKNNRFSAYIQKLDGNNTKDNKSDQLKMYEQLVEHLTQELETQRIEFDTNEQLTIQRINSDYNIILADTENLYKRRLKTLESKLKREHQAEISSLKQTHEYQLNKNNKRAKVICLDSSNEDEDSDDDIADLKEELQSSKEKINKYKNTIDKLQLEIFELEKYKKETNEIKHKNVYLKNKISELESTLEEAKESYIELEGILTKTEEENKQYKSEIFSLKENIAYLEQNLSENQQDLARKVRIIEELEEKGISDKTDVYNEDNFEETVPTLNLLNRIKELQNEQLGSDNEVSFTNRPQQFQ